MEELLMMKQELEPGQESLSDLLLSLEKNRPDLSTLILVNAKRELVDSKPTRVLRQLIQYAIIKSDIVFIRWLVKLNTPFFLTFEQKFDLLYTLVSNGSVEIEQVALELVRKHEYDRLDIARLARSVSRTGTDTLICLVVKNYMPLLFEELLKYGALIDGASACAIIKSYYRQQLTLALIKGTCNNEENRNSQVDRLFLAFIRYYNKETEFDSFLKLDLPWTVMKSIDCAIRWRMIDIIKCLLKYHPEVAHEPRLLRTASEHEETSITRLLIEHGADINAQEYGLHAIHVACREKSLKNAHLLIHLGADLKLTNKSGRTPFTLLTEKLSERAIRQRNYEYRFQHEEFILDMFLKHFAILFFKGIPISHKDQTIINEHSKNQKYLECLSELERMKVTFLYNNVPFSCFFRNNDKQLLALMRNDDFVDHFNATIQERHVLFPNYSAHLTQLFEIASTKKNILASYEQKLEQVFNEILPMTVPYDITEKIVEYVTWDDLKIVERNYYMHLHEQIENHVPGYEIAIIQ